MMNDEYRMMVKISATWQKRYEMYIKVAGTALTLDEQQELYIFESLGKKKWQEQYPGRNAPRGLWVKQAYDLLNTEIRDIIKYSLCFEHWYWLYETSTLLGCNVTPEILDYMLGKKTLTNYQREVQKCLWDNHGKFWNELDADGCANPDLWRYALEEKWWKRIKMWWYATDRKQFTAFRHKYQMVSHSLSNSDKQVKQIAANHYA